MRGLLVGAVAATVACAQSSAAQSKGPLPFASFELAGEAVLNDPHDLALGPDGMIYVADKFAGRVAVMDPETLALAWSFGDGALAGVHDVSFGPDGRLYAAVTGRDAVAVFEIEGRTATPVAMIPGLARTEGALAHSNGTLYAMAGGVGQLVALRDGAVVASAGGMPGAHDVAEAPDGTIWVADNFARRLVNFDQDLNFLREVSHPKFGLVGPRYLDIDEFGRLVVADQDAHRVLLIDPEGPEGGALLGVIGSGVPGSEPGQFDDPEGALVTGSRYYFADSDNNRIVRYSVVMN